MNSNSIFTGEVILVYLIAPPTEFARGLAICRPRIEEKLGRYFVVGIVPSNPEDWSSGMPIFVAFDQIAHYLEFQDENDFVEKAGSSIAGMDRDSLQ
jgi:hypothetical protein